MKSKAVIGTRHWYPDTHHIEGSADPLVAEDGTLHQADTVCDARQIPLPSHSFQYVWSSECLEHFPWKETPAIVAEWARLVAPGGTLRIEVPDFCAAAQQLLSQETLELHLAMNQIFFGGQINQWDFHFAGITHLTLPHFMEQAGLVITGVWRGYEVGWLRVDGQRAG